jgi:precorrin-6B methylase 2
MRSFRILAVAVAIVVAAGAAALFDDGEATRISQVLHLEAGQVVADVGAGDGEWSVDLARRVGPTGHVWATEVNDRDLAEIRRRVEKAGLENVTVVEGDQQQTGLPQGCCDAILVRMVYHHFTDPPAMRRSLRQALRPGGRLAILDIEPQKNWRKLKGVPQRGGHGIPADDLVREMTADGFEVVSRHEDWNGDEDRYCIVFRR